MMGKYWLTTRRFKAKPNFSGIKFWWRHTLRYGRNSIAVWTATDKSYMTVQQFTYIHDHHPDLIQVVIEQSKCKINQVLHLNAPTTEPSDK